VKACADDLDAARRLDLPAETQELRDLRSTAAAHLHGAK
jgi:hypothetical protein